MFLDYIRDRRNARLPQLNGKGRGLGHLAGVVEVPDEAAGFLLRPHGQAALATGPKFPPSN